MKQAYIKWLEEQHWSFFGTFTTSYELTIKSGRRAMERYFEKLLFLANGDCRIFFVTEPFELKDGMHLHCLIHLPEHFHEKEHYSKLIDAWQMVTGKGRYVKDKYDQWVKPKQHRVDLQRYDPERKAGGYCAKYILKNNCDYDILIPKGKV